ncbi:hydroxymethylglutaryl-CoA reductase, degradative [Dellaglioa algida]|uniref:3-hydroxy-3-methylglutaryl coenzyme A reductase n=1 Tax=Dellaglioa algida TaxID=105612 RepID=A0A5C6M8J8_9LACO|nr:hydroxymethylglutaryl-CoA reductase, degradative [Dellaglioa algida]MDK1717530.1 hydroxymethylglutaryl-CoA reductase, degradative [Dellaglioa algida]MDK1720830.1 hydroxymethylglutaryl-CoA reductase, degradative [Dellaglioa algida]MDK1722499.1 hydroxymethylglutaryl-CoA reductase, degradative [Dellaglioa algida]MDK1724096.1 hydroxymethylglutaryl-CoA reductase, degradative [Dellaglioa algida]MDK1725704.1 hydroxymethylglutaryl-CoA reductase, degradative [Dellaglioa algida]
MTKLIKFYQKKWQDRLNILLNDGLISDEARKEIEKSSPNHELNNQMTENYIADFTLPEGVAFHYLVDGKEVTVPMVTEEPSVIAASNNGAKIIASAGGFTTKIDSRLMIGQVILENVEEADKTIKQIDAQKAYLIEVANAARPSLVKRGGGARWVRVRKLADDLLSIDLAIDVQAAMGANSVNTMMEVVGDVLRRELNQDVLMSILSNYATESLVESSCSVPIFLLDAVHMDGQELAKKIVSASRVAQLDPYRAVTHNKGVMNGIDAALIGSGNDWRAIEAGAHAYASRDGQYRGLTSWTIIGDNLVGTIKVPMPVGVVGGSIDIVPMVQINKKMMGIGSAKELAGVIASVGLAQNFAALKALVSDGIQKGHMGLQLKSLAVKVGAMNEEVGQLTELLKHEIRPDTAIATQKLKDLRRKGER